MNRYISYIFIAILLGFNTSYGASQSLIQSSIKISQLETYLKFNVEIKNDLLTDQYFKLSALALVKKSDQLSIEKDPAGTQILVLKGKTIANIEYEIPYDPQKPAYYITSDDLWFPVLQNSQMQIFKIFSELKPSHQLIDSATGQSESDLAFVFCKCKKYSNKDGRLHIYLFNEDPGLAQTVLTELEAYLTQYEKDIGPYPYDHFSVVESIEEVGYAFPKMTWIGSQLLHFPFILKTSLPHELLHSWWGNGVFVNYQMGNWCEGLTSFGADYHFLDEEGRKLYRLKAITSYLDYAHSGAEIPLSKFTSRGEDKALQAIGYDKAMMVFLMAEQRVGEAIFKQAQKEFYQRFKYQMASYEDFFSVLEELSHLDFTQFKKFWIYSTGLLPQDLIQAEWSPSEKNLIFKSKTNELQKIPGQTLETEVYFNNVPAKNISLHVNDQGSSIENISTTLGIKPQSYSFDPNFLLFRNLYTGEKPVTFSQGFAAKSLKVISTDEDLNSAIKTEFPNASIENISEKPDFSKTQILFIDGKQLEKVPELVSLLKERNTSLNSESFTFLNKNFSFTDHSLFLSLRVQNTLVVLLCLGKTQSDQRWLQRWHHYGAKGYLVLSPNSADLQGLWLSEFRQPL